MLTWSYINTALSQSAFRIYKCYIIMRFKISGYQFQKIFKISYFVNNVLAIAVKFSCNFLFNSLKFYFLAKFIIG